MPLVYNIFDMNVREGQRVYYILNEYYSKETSGFSGGLILKKFDSENSEGEYSRLSALADREVLSDITELITGKRKALVFETNFFNSIFFYGFLNALNNSEKKFDLLYSSSLSYIVMSMYLVSENMNDFRKMILNFFSESKINKFLDITFPEEYVFKNNLISKFADEIFAKNRIETFENIPAAMFGEDGINSRRIFSTGFQRDLIAASFCIYPIFDQPKISKNYYNSGYPSLKVRVEDLFRTDVDEIVYVSVNNRSNLNYRNGRLLKFYEKYIDFIELNNYDDKMSNLADKNLVIDVSEKEVKTEKILELSEKNYK